MLTSLDSRVPVNLLEGTKTRPIFIQVVETHQLCIYETDTSRRARHSINLQQSICEIFTHDVSGRAISVISPSNVIVLSFPSAADAKTVLDLFNAKSDIFKDRDSMQQLDRHIENVWPFPFRE
jgi:hypothetical protein